MCPPVGVSPIYIPHSTSHTPRFLTLRALTILLMDSNCPAQLLSGKKNPPPKKALTPINSTENNLCKQFAQTLSACLLFIWKERGRTIVHEQPRKLLRKLFLLGCVFLPWYFSAWCPLWSVTHSCNPCKSDCSVNDGTMLINWCGSQVHPIGRLFWYEIPAFSQIGCPNLWHIHPLIAVNSCYFVTCRRLMAVNSVFAKSTLPNKPAKWTHLRFH